MPCRRLGGPSFCWGRTSSPSASIHSSARLLHRHRAEAQDVGHPHDVLAQPCHVCGVTAKSSCRAALLVASSVSSGTEWSVLVDPVEQPGAQALDLTQAPRNAPIVVLPSTGPTCRRNQSRTMGSTWTLRRFDALPLGSSQCSGWSGWSGQGGRCGTRSFDVGDLLVRERPVDGCLLVATRSGAVGGPHAEARGGSGCAPGEHVLTAAASWSRPADRLRRI